MSKEGRGLIPAELRQALGFRAEAQLQLHGVSCDEVLAISQQLPLQGVPFSAQQAVCAGSLRPATRALGPSLGDRCRLALAQDHPGAPAVTADRPWAGLAGFQVALIR